MATFEESLASSIFQQQAEKSFIDKVLARDDIAAVRELVKKPKLTRSELLDLLYSIVSTEAKLVNYGEWERYVILKFFVWIRETIKIAEILYDYQDDLKIKTSYCSTCKKYVKGDKLVFPKPKCECKEPLTEFEISPRTKKLLDNNERLIEHNAKFLTDLYLNIARTSLSLGATGFMNTLTNKFEFTYPGQPVTQPMPEQKRFGIFPVKR